MKKHQKRRDMWDLSGAIDRYAPRKIAIRKVADNEHAVYLFAAIRARILALVAHLEIVLTATKNCPGLTKQVVICLGKLESLSRAEFCVWRAKPNPAFEGIAPQDYFRLKGLSELENALGLRFTPRKD